MQAIILAGGKGTRLKPFTTNFPKPLVPVDSMPILEIVLKQLKGYGFTDIILTVGHLAELIITFFGDGKKLGLNITYSREDEPLGTAGPLSQCENLDDNFLVMNGDLLTTLNYKELMNFHLKNRADVTITTYKKEVIIDLGVLKLTNDDFDDYLEKPTYTFDVSTGIYVVNKNMIKNIPKNTKYDMPDFILHLKKTHKTLKCFRENFFWLDIGRLEDYEKAQEIFSVRKKEFLPYE